MSFFVDLFYNFLDLFGLRGKKAKLVFLGLDNSGKTTLMHVLKTDVICQHEPTRCPKEFSLGGIRFITYDLGGHQQARRLWKDRFFGMDAIVFLVDAADPNRILEAREELQSLLTDDHVYQLPILILGNKIDRPNAFSEEQLKTQLGISDFCTGKDPVDRSELIGRPMEVFMCSVVHRVGYGQGFRWLSHYL
uniref:Uncharacterized protein n=1 Tax=Panagrolaimus sp. JU765 TaxID=591449 RepID=A0AC34R3P0_9BILA